MRVPLSWLNALHREPLSRATVDELLGEAGAVVTSVDAVGALHPRVVVGEVTGVPSAGTVEVLVPTREIVSLDPHLGILPVVGAKVAVALPGALLFRHASSRTSNGPAGTARVPQGRGPGTPTGRVCLGPDLGLPSHDVVRLPEHARPGQQVAPLLDPLAGDEVLTVRAPQHLPGMHSVRGLAAELAARLDVEVVRPVPAARLGESGRLRVRAPGMAAVAMVCERPPENLGMDDHVARWRALAGLGGASVQQRLLEVVAFEQGVYLSTHPHDLTVPDLTMRPAVPEPRSGESDGTARHPGLVLDGLTTPVDPATASGVLIVASSVHDEERCLDALHRAARLLGVRPVSVSRGSGPARVLRHLDLDLGLLARRTGLFLAEPDVRGLLARIGAQVRADRDGTVAVMVPDDRADLHDEPALAAEIVRLAGLGAITPTLPAAFREGGASPMRRESRAADAVRDSGFREVVTPLLRPSGPAGPASDEDDVVRIADGTASPLRQELAEGLIRVALGVVAAGHADQGVRVFEVGTVVTGGPGAVEERRFLSTVELTPGTSPRRLDPSELVRSVVAALGRAHPVVLAPEAGTPSGFANGWRIVVGEVDCGRVRRGTVSESGKDDHAVTVVDLDLGRVAGLPRRHVKVPSTPRFPVAVRDLTFVLSGGTDVHRLTSMLSQVDPLVTRVELVDIFSRTSDGTTSATVRLVFASPWRSVPRPEVAEVVARAVERCEGQGFRLRS
ncbi:hypothetical protein [Cellulosimicrobium cellulans]|uniref:Uncharacterized protein n=1 Tax=Cellulosimicrobium cellulans TaxID=1710 RepID=A0A4Y4E094_CELCE|nr:hypothetical protein [Cellulosimicrobium cellulans]GED10756.1 hypothetical protein CCE02nite_27550 [Cellulosimicrobium cellulans]